jgi:hypothetical protein
MAAVAFRFGNDTYRLSAADSELIKERLQHKLAVPEGAASLADELAEGHTELAPTRDEELELLEVMRQGGSHSDEWELLLACLEQRAGRMG